MSQKINKKRWPESEIFEEFCMHLPGDNYLIFTFRFSVHVQHPDIGVKKAHICTKWRAFTSDLER